MRVFVALLALKARAVRVDVLQLPRYRPALPARTSAIARSMAMTTEFDFGAVAKSMAASARGSRLRQAQLQGRVHAGLDYHRRLRVGQANVLQAEHKSPPAPMRSPVLQSPRQVGAAPRPGPSRAGTS